CQCKRQCEMPGLIGAVQRAPGQDVQPVFAALLAPLQRSRRLQSEICIAPHGQWALGRIHLGVLQPTSQLTGDARLQVLFHGELYNEIELRQMLATEHTALPDKNVGSLIRALYRVYGIRFASLIQGAFCAAVLDESSKKLVLANDVLGSYFLYWFN